MSKLNGNLSIFNQLKPVSVGFENMFDSFEKMFENDGFESLDNYPYYNIVLERIIPESKKPRTIEIN
ncbi:MAG: hypothetical protein EBV81_00645 [Proteobacteria bacterium]|nr:hypothetical protein [Candidatus Fonsibacter sp. PEL5]